jgi:hypothetical protein
VVGGVVIGRLGNLRGSGRTKKRRKRTGWRRKPNLEAWEKKVVKR